MPLRNVNDPTSITTAEGFSTTRTHLSTNIIILVNGRSVAALQQLSVTETRNVQAIDEIGTDGHIDSVPTKSTDITGNANRVRFARQRIAEAFDRGFVHIAAQRIPFDIEIQDKFAGTDAESVIITTLRNVWLQNIVTPYNAGDFLISETMSFMAESIDSVLGSGGNVVGSVNNRGLPLVVNPFESSADRGQYRGALDGAGLLNAFDGFAGRAL